jgi:NAD(P)H-hydrate epimerase
MEAMVDTDKNEKYFTDSGDTDSYSAVGIGPGLGTRSESRNGLQELLKSCKKPVVIDADGLNMISMNKDWYHLIPEGSVLTPHPKEFERIAGKSDNSFIRLTRQIEFSSKYKCIVVLKGAYTTIATPDGSVFFNSTGNPGMATAGSGDALTGIILSLLSQGYKPENAAVLGVYLHGLAGDLAAADLSYESIIASDIINYIGAAFNKLREP